jgi:hypothetical protein
MDKRARAVPDDHSKKISEIWFALECWHLAHMLLMRKCGFYTEADKPLGLRRISARVAKLAAVMDRIRDQRGWGPETVERAMHTLRKVRIRHMDPNSPRAQACSVSADGDVVVGRQSGGRSPNDPRTLH